MPVSNPIPTQVLRFGHMVAPATILLALWHGYRFVYAALLVALPFILVCWASFL